MYLVEVSQGFLFSHEHLGKLCALLWVQPHHVSQQENVVRSVANLLGIQNDLLVLASLSKTLDHLHGSIKKEVVCDFLINAHQNWEPLHMHMHTVTVIFPTILLHL